MRIIMFILKCLVPSHKKREDQVLSPIFLQSGGEPLLSLRSEWLDNLRRLIIVQYLPTSITLLLLLTLQIMCHLKIIFFHNRGDMEGLETSQPYSCTTQNLPKLKAKITQDHITANLTHLSFSVHLLLYHQWQFKSFKLVQTEICCNSLG